MGEQDHIIHYGWLDLFSESSTGAWGKLSGKKQWKKRFIVLNQSSSNEDDIFLQAFEKEEHWKLTQPKKSLSLFPHYKVYKLNGFKGKEKVLEVNNETEQWYFASDKNKIINLWACQIQMQTKLSRMITGRIFTVSGSVDKDMQTIGAAQQKCLLHFTKWGITLALQDSRAILAMWPTKTIRNYESSGQCEFIIEAGRRAPMGEGVFKFYTNIGQDVEMFNVIDAFVSALLNEKATLQANGKPNSTPKDDDISIIYDQLHKSAIGLNAEHRPKFRNSPEPPGYSHLGTGMTMNSTPAKIQRQISKFSIHKPPEYDHLFGDDSVDYNHIQIDEKKHSISSFSSDASPRGLSFSEQSYDKLGGSWGTTDGADGAYDHINQRHYSGSGYDQINRNSSVKKKTSSGMVGYPLRDEPSVPCLDMDDQSFKGRSPIQQTPENEKFIFRNSIYSDLDGTTNGTNQNMARGVDSRTGSTVSEGGASYRRGISINERSIQDLADHFMYQVPSSLNSIEGVSIGEDVYQNTASSTLSDGGQTIATMEDAYQQMSSPPDEPNTHQNIGAVNNLEETANS